MSTDATTALRLQLLANGYVPLANLDKRCFLGDWPKLQVDEALIRRWARSRRFKATGLRLDGLGAIDLDVPLDDEAFDALVWEPLADVLGDKLDEMPLRYGNGNKAALFFRPAEDWNHVRSRTFLLSGSLDSGKTGFVEAFGGATPRQFGAYGAHTLDEETGEVIREYRWADGPTPHNTPLAALPVLAKAEVLDALQAVEDALAARFEPVLAAPHGEDAHDRVFDLTDDMRFDLNTGETVTLDELRARSGETRLRCSASWLEGPTAVNRSRCLVSWTQEGELAIYETAASVTHLPADAAPRDPLHGTGPSSLAGAIARLAESAGGETFFEGPRAEEVPPPRARAETPSWATRPDTSAPLARTVAWLLAAYGYAPHDTKCVVPLNGVDAPMALANFKVLISPYAVEEVGPRGGLIQLNPASIWATSPDRTVVAGRRFRPGATPVFEEDGSTYVNLFRPLRHPTKGGDTGPAHEFFANLLRAENEREWFLDWLAYKLQHPERSAVGVIMQAPGIYGTGRGTLFNLIARLTQNQVGFATYEEITSRAGQAQYNATWLAKSLFVLVNESREEVVNIYGERSRAYEQLKKLVDPVPRDMAVIEKFGAKYIDRISACVLIATNHRDAVSFPEDDRRFAVLLNDYVAPSAFWVSFFAWMEDPANIGALYRELMARDVSMFNAAMPLLTATRNTAIDASRSDVEKLLHETLDELRSPFTGGQVRNRMRILAQGSDELELPPNWKKIMSRLLGEHAHRVGSGAQHRLCVATAKHSIYVKKLAEVAAWTPVEWGGHRIDLEGLKNALKENGPLSEASGLQLIQGGRAD